MKVLCIDDDPTIAALLSLLVTDCGHKSVVLTDPMLAEPHLFDPDVQAVLTDYMMPRMNGIEVLRLCQKLRPGIRRVMVTAAAHEHPVIEALRQGLAHQVILKPPSPGDICAALGCGH